MRVVIQRVLEAKCVVDDNITGEIKNGYVLLIGYTFGDDELIIDKVIKKIINLRIFSDEEGKLNKSLKDINGEILAISQFTLYADLAHGNRPSFTKALSYDLASKYYDLFVNKLKENNIDVKCGIFGADMKIHLVNDGPVTIILDSLDL